MALGLVGGLFLAAGTVASAVGLGAMVTIAGLSITWAAAATVVGVALMAVSALTMKVPRPDSQGQQLQTKLDPTASVPVLYGRSATGGTTVYREVSGKDNIYLHMALALSVGGPIHNIESTFASDLLLTLGGDAMAAASTVTGTTPPSAKLYAGDKFALRYLVGETGGSAPTLDSALGSYGVMPGTPGRASGVAMALLRAEFNADAFPQGVPKLVFVASGQKVYDPRKDSTYPGGSGSHRIDNYSTWEFSENPYLCALNWTLGKFEGGKKLFGIGAKPAEIDIPAFVRGANVADANGWKVGGVVTSNDNKFAVLATILQAGGGLAIARGAQISCLVNAPVTSLTTLTKGDVIGEIAIQNTNAYRDRHNTVVPIYREESQQWQLIQGEQVTSSVYVDEDAGDVKTREVELPMVQQAAQAHQLATYELCNSREFLTFTANVKSRFLDVRVGDAVTVNVSEIAAENIKCLVVQREFSPADYSVTLTLKAESEGKHPFALGQSQVAPESPSLNEYDPTNPPAPAPGSWVATGTQLVGPDGISTPIITITGAVDNPYAREVVIEYKPEVASEWISHGVFPKETTSVDITSIIPKTSYDVGISYRTIHNVTTPRLVLSGTSGAFEIDWSGGVIVGPNLPTRNVYRGIWAAGQSYQEGDFVFHDGSTYVVTADHISTIPPPSANYGLMAEGGTVADDKYIWMAYADDEFGLTNFTVGNWNGHTYIGFALNKTTSVESNNPADYKWSKLTGENGMNTARVALYRRSATMPAIPSQTATYRFSTAVLTGHNNGWSQAAVATDGNPLWRIEAPAVSVLDTDTIEPGEWTAPIIMVQDGAPGTPATTAAIHPNTRQVPSYSNGGVTSYAGLSANVSVTSGNNDVSSSFTLSTLSNPQGLTVSYSGRTMTISGAASTAGQFGYESVDTALLTIRATGSGAFAGVTHDVVFSLQKVRGGYEIVSSLPTSNLFVGRVVFLTSNDKLYSYSGTAWVAQIDTSSTIVASQVQGALTAANLPATSITGQLSNAQIDELAATKIIGTITGTQVADNAISTPKLATNSVTAQKLAVGSVTADKLLAGSVTAIKLASDSVVSDKIAANAVTSSKIIANGITSNHITAGAVTVEKLGANSVTADKIQAGAVTAAKMNVTSLSAITANIGTMRTATSGARLEISSNVIKVFDNAGVLRVKLGNLSL
jgi:hypothetical protein